MKSVAAFHTSQGVYEMEFLEIPPLPFHVDIFRVAFLGHISLNAALWGGLAAASCERGIPN